MCMNAYASYLYLVIPIFPFASLTPCWRKSLQPLRTAWGSNDFSHNQYLTPLLGRKSLHPKSRLVRVSSEVSYIYNSMSLSRALHMHNSCLIIAFLKHFPSRGFLTCMVSYVYSSFSQAFPFSGYYVCDS